MNSQQVYLYTYHARDGSPHQTRVTIVEHGSHEGNVIYVLEPVAGKWPHRPDHTGTLWKAVVMTPAEEHEFKNVDLVAEGGGDS